MFYLFKNTSWLGTKKVKNIKRSILMVALTVLLLAFVSILLITVPTKKTSALKVKWEKLPEDAGYVRVIASHLEKESKFSVNEHNDIVLAIHFRLQNDWKIFVANRFEKDTYPKITFQNQKNIKNHEIAYEKPIILNEYKGIVPESAGFYNDNFVVIVKIVPESLTNNTKLDLQIEYNLCREGCITEMDNFEINITPKYYNEEIIKFAKSNLPENIRTDFIGHNITIYMVLMAFFGGLLLNIMPCVLPVISIKIFSLVNYSKRDTSTVRLGFLFSALGIIVSFLVIGEILVALKMAGKNVGWGFYLQNPKVLIFGMIMIAIFISTLLGYLNITLDSKISSAIEKNISKVETKALGTQKKYLHLFGDFLSGAFTTLLATPCSAPLLGTAITFALTRANHEIFFIFIAMGIGMSVPYLMLCLFPKAIKILPKPGEWIKVFERMLALILFTLLLWIAHILHHDVGSVTSFYIVLLCLVIIWQFKVTKNEIWGIITLIAISVFIAIIPIRMAEKQVDMDELDKKIWIKFNEKAIQEYVNQGNIVVIDIGADWCLTCKVNRILVFRDEDVLRQLNRSDVVAMRGDITKPNPELTEFMKGMGRHAIPFVAVFGPSIPYGKTCPELVKKRKLLKTIEEADKKRIVEKLPKSLTPELE